jgi:SOUL heme-binding protein
MRMAALLSNLLLGGCTVFGIRGGTEQPPYTVTEHIGTIEVRQYGARTAAEVTVEDSEEAARSDGFRKLARYIFGGNVGQHSVAMTAPVAQSGEQIAMTAPVSQAVTGADTWTIRFFLPADLTVETAPKPLDASIRLVAVPPATMAVLRFPGTPSAAAVGKQRTQLMTGLRTASWVPAAEPVAWFYDPPWTLPWLRRNEVAVEVHRP